MAKNFRSLFKVAEPAVTMATGFIAEPVAGLAGLATANPDNVGRVRDALTYAPRTPEGRQGMQNLAEAVSPALPFLDAAGTAGEWAGNRIMDATGSPALATAARVVPEALSEMNPFGRAGNAARGMVAGIKRAKPEMLERVAQLKAEGFDRDQIYGITMREYGQGYFEDIQTGQQLFEFSDAGMKPTETFPEWNEWMKKQNVGESSRPVKHNVLIEHPELDALNDPVKIALWKPPDNNVNGFATKGTAYTTINNSIDEQMDTLSHEIGHIFQERDDMPGGGNVEYFLREANQPSHADLQRRMARAKTELAILDEEPVTPQNLARRKELVEMQRNDWKAINDAYTKYENLWGEAYARAIASRRHRTPDELAALPIYKDLKTTRGAPMDEASLTITQADKARVMRAIMQKAQGQ